MKVCSACRKEVSISTYFNRKSGCPHCGADLHACINCGLYRETSHNKCAEPRSEFQRDREKANFCEYFIYREDAGPAREGSDPAEEARRKLKDLFS